MKNPILVLFAIIIFCSCQNKKEENGNRNPNNTVLANERHQYNQMKDLKIDKVYIGMPIDSLRRIYCDSEFLEEPVYKYGIDEESNGLVVVRDGERLFFAWTGQEMGKIKGITVLSTSLLIDDNVHVGMTLKFFLDKYPDAKVELDMINQDYEYIHLPHLNYTVEFLTTDSTRVAAYDHNSAVPEFIRIVREQSKIDRISLN